MTSNIYQIKVTLKDTKPSVWRRILVPSSISLNRFHEILQIIMGWSDYHLHQFTIGAREFGEPSEDDEAFGIEIFNDKKFYLNKLVLVENFKFDYWYDFGDNWHHDVVVEKILQKEDSKSYPICIAGKKACPPEDVGGTGGYEKLLHAIKHPDNPEDEWEKELLEWVDENFDPEDFNLEEVNKQLRKSH